MGFPGSILTPVYQFLSKVELHVHSKGCDDLFYLHHLLGLSIREFLQRKLFCVILNNFQQNCQEIKKQVLQPLSEGLCSQQCDHSHSSFSVVPPKHQLSSLQPVFRVQLLLGSMHFQALWHHQPLPRKMQTHTQTEGLLP